MKVRRQLILSAGWPMTRHNRQRREEKKQCPKQLIKRWNMSQEAYLKWSARGVVLVAPCFSYFQHVRLYTHAVHRAAAGWGTSAGLRPVPRAGNGRTADAGAQREPWPRRRESQPRRHKQDPRRSPYLALRTPNSFCDRALKLGKLFFLFKFSLLYVYIFMYTLAHYRLNAHSPLGPQSTSIEF